MRTLYLALIGISLMAFPSEAETNLAQIIWCSSCLAVMGISAFLLNRLEKKEGKNGM